MNKGIQNNRIQQLLAEAFQACQAGQLDRSRALCEDILEKSPGTVDALELLGVVLSQVGELPRAIDLLTRAVTLQPDNPAFHSNLAKSLMLAGRCTEGVHHYSKVVQLCPDQGQVLYDLGNARVQAGQPDVAIVQLQRALQLMGNDPFVLTALGNASRLLGRTKDAVESYRHALQLSPDMAEIIVNLGLALQEHGDTEQAAGCLERALELAPDDADAHLNYAVCCLQQGRFVPGWAEYEWRWKRPDKLKRPFTLPAWDGSDLAGRSILIYAEQGIGDEIMFASCIPDLCDLADRVVLECEPRLAPLFARSFPNAVVHGGYQDEPADWLAASGGADVQLACGSLPRLLRPGETGFPDRTAYLVPDDLRVQKWRERYTALGEGLKVGLTWKGGGNELNRIRRSIDLVDWAPILSLEGMVFVNLQYGDCREEIRGIQESLGTTIHDWPDADPLKNLDDFAAQLCALDLVIAIDNSTAHMAGALGVSAWVLLSRVPDWRWMLEREDSPWYPGVSLLRQVRDDDWNPVFETVSMKLREIICRDS